MALSKAHPVLPLLQFAQPPTKSRWLIMLEIKVFTKHCLGTCGKWRQWGRRRQPRARGGLQRDLWRSQFRLFENWLSLTPRTSLLVSWSAWMLHWKWLLLLTLMLLLLLLLLLLMCWWKLLWSWWSRWWLWLLLWDFHCLSFFWWRSPLRFPLLQWVQVLFSGGTLLIRLNSIWFKARWPHLFPCHISLQKHAPVLSLQPMLPLAKHWWGRGVDVQAESWISRFHPTLHVGCHDMTRSYWSTQKDAIEEGLPCISDHSLAPMFQVCNLDIVMIINIVVVVTKITITTTMTFIIINDYQQPAKLSAMWPHPAWIAGARGGRRAVAVNTPAGGESVKVKVWKWKLESWKVWKWKCESESVGVKVWKWKKIMSAPSWTSRHAFTRLRTAKPERRTIITQFSANST